MKYRDAYKIIVLAAIVAVSTSTANAIYTGGNAEGVNVTILGVFSTTSANENGIGNPMFVDMYINAAPNMEKMVAKIIDTEGAPYDLATMSLSPNDKQNLAHQRHVFGCDLPAFAKVKYIKFEGTSSSLEMTPFLVKVNETPDIFIPLCSQVSDLGGHIIYLLNATPNHTVDNISINPERIYVIPVGWNLFTLMQNDQVNWVVGIKVENEGPDARQIKYNDFKIEDQYGWEYKTLGFTSYNPKADFFDNTNRYDRSHCGREGLDEHLTLLPGESLRIGLLLKKISGISVPDTIIYMNQSIKIDEVTATTDAPPW